MKKSVLKIVAMVLAMVLMLALFVSCDQQGEQGPAGPQGEQGIQGEPGVNGTNGVDGKSAYELAVDKGYTGTVEEWLASLVGEVGATGQAGANGQSAYEIAVKNGYTGTEAEWLASLVGAKGDDGKSAYEIAVDNGYEGTEEEWLESLVGEKGDDGLSAFEIYQKYHPEYAGTEEEWIESLKGADGEKGEQGVSVVNAYINSEMHLILVLSNNTQIDAGYVGVTVTPTPTTYTVTFVDYNGTELKKETVESGNSATAPADPVREGYIFTGWDKNFDNVTADLIATAQYELAVTEPTIVVGNATAVAGESVTVTVNITANPGVAGAKFKIEYDSKLTLTSAESGSAFSVLDYTGPATLTSGCPFNWDSLDAESTVNGTILTLTFTVSENATVGEKLNISVSYVDGDVYNADLDDLTFDLINGVITVE